MVWFGFVSFLHARVYRVLDWFLQKLEKGMGSPGVTDIVRIVKIVFVLIVDQR